MTFIIINIFNFNNDLSSHLQKINDNKSENKMIKEAILYENDWAENIYFKFNKL